MKTAHFVAVDMRCGAWTARVRRYRPDDLDALYRICLQTSYHGGDGTALFRDPRLPGHVYAAPYGLFEPSLAFVAKDAAGVGGYIVAALNGETFEQRLERSGGPHCVPGTQNHHRSWPRRYRRRSNVRFTTSTIISAPPGKWPSGPVAPAHQSAAADARARDGTAAGHDADFGPS